MTTFRRKTFRIAAWMVGCCIFALECEAEEEAHLAPVSASYSNSNDQPAATVQSESPQQMSESEGASRFVLPQGKHLWGQFPVGSWREVEITTETFDEQGKLLGRSVTTQKEVLKAVAEDSYALEVQATVDFAQKRIAGPANTRILRLATDKTGTIFSSKRLPDQQLQLGDAFIDCQVWDVTYNEETGNYRDRIHYAPEIFPYVLRRESFERREDSPVEPLALETSRVLMTTMPYRVRGGIVSCACERILRRRDKGHTQTMRFLNREIPGGEVSLWSADFDAEGRRVRWTILKLLASGQASPELEP